MIPYDGFLYTVSSFSVNSTLSGILGQAVEGMDEYTYIYMYTVQCIVYIVYIH